MTRVSALRSVLLLSRGVVQGTPGRFPLPRTLPTSIKPATWSRNETTQQGGRQQHQLLFIIHCGVVIVCCRDLDIRATTPYWRLRLEQSSLVLRAFGPTSVCSAGVWEWGEADSRLGNLEICVSHGCTAACQNLLCTSGSTLEASTDIPSFSIGQATAAAFSCGWLCAQPSLRDECCGVRPSLRRHRYSHRGGALTIGDDRRFQDLKFNRPERANRARERDRNLNLCASRQGKIFVPTPSPPAPSGFTTCPPLQPCLSPPHAACEGRGVHVPRTVPRREPKKHHWNQFCTVQARSSPAVLCSSRGARSAWPRAR